MYDTRQEPMWINSSLDKHVTSHMREVEGVIPKTEFGMQFI